MSDETELNPRQLQFILHYLATGNGTRAYQAAYAEEKPETAAPAASRLLKHPAVKAHVAAVRAGAISKSEVTAEYSHCPHQRLGGYCLI